MSEERNLTIEVFEVLGKPVSGIMFRVAAEKYGDEPEILNGEGTFVYGGRWLKAGVARAVHGSFDPVAAMDEYWNATGAKGFAGKGRMPSIARRLAFKAMRMVDLTDVKVASTLGLSGAWWTGSYATAAAGGETQAQEIGRLAFGAGVSGLIVPSAVIAGGRNIVIFPANIRGALGEEFRVDDR